MENHEGKQEQQQTETVSKEDYDTLSNELEQLKQSIPAEPSEQEQALAAKEQELFNKSVELELKANGLDAFAPVVKVENEEDLQATIEQLKTIQNNIKIESGYVPTDHAKDDEYSTFQKEGNTQGMIASKLSKLFK